MKITINKESSVPLRDQLVEQIGLQIASGTLASKEKLPSIRALADRLGIHYSTVTAAYNHLAEVGLLEIRQGSGVRVASAGKASENSGRGSSLEGMFVEFLAKASESGYSCKEVTTCLRALEKRKPVKRIQAVDRNKDFHQLLIAELAPHFSIPVVPCTVEEFIADRKNLDESLVVSSLYHIFAFQQYVTDPTRLIACNIEPGRAEIDSVDQLPTGSLVLLVSVSTTLMNMATRLIAAKRGEDVAVRTVHISDEKELKYMVKYATLILCDSSCEQAMVPLAGKTKLVVFRLYSPSTIDLIKDRLNKWG